MSTYGLSKPFEIVSKAGGGRGVSTMNDKNLFGNFELVP